MKALAIKEAQSLREVDLIKALLVENNHIDSKKVERILSKRFQTYVFAVDLVMYLSEAETRLEGNAYSIVLLDLTLPDSQGIESVQRIRCVNRDIPIVVLIGQDDEQTGLAAIRNGASDYLIKDRLFGHMLIRTMIHAVARSEVVQQICKESRVVLERKVAERTEQYEKVNESLRNVEKNLRTIIQHNADGIIIIDRQGVIRFVNDAAEALFDLTKEELVGQVFGYAVAKDKSTEIELIHHHSVLTVEMRVVEINWEGQRVYLASLRNITERKQAEDKIIETMSMKTEFISMVSHELRTPLTAIKEGIALVADGLTGDINEEQQEVLTIARNNVDRLARLINDVLDFHKLESGKMSFSMQFHNINDVAQEVFSTMAASARERGIRFLQDLDNSLPAIEFDKDKITQVLTNLVTNALKFTHEGEIRIKTAQGENSIIVSVTDTGQGIRNDDLPRVFEKFEQLGCGGQRKTGGTGLGLAISKELIEKHHGIISVESQYGKGSTFSFSLPLHCHEDVLGGLIEDQVEQARRNSIPLSVLLISIAEKCSANDPLSEEQVKTILQEIRSKVKHKLCRTGNERGRFCTGDMVYLLSREILVVLTDCRKADSQRISARLNEHLRAQFEFENLSQKIDMRIGYASYPEDGRTAKDLVELLRKTKLSSVAMSI